MSFLAIFILALLTSLVFAPGYRKGSLAPLAIFFLILFLAGIASQYWIIPFGPLWWGVSWMPLLFTIIMVSILFAAPFPHFRRPGKINASEELAAEETTVSTVLSLFIWVLIVMLLAAILIGVFKRPSL